MDLPARTKALAIALTGEPSVNGSPGEAAFGRFLADLLSTHPRGERLEVVSVPADGDPLERPVVVARLKGAGELRAAVVMGHYDTVGTADFGDHEAIARSPEALSRLYADHPDPVVREDAADGMHLFGRGMLDMKSGLAAMVAVLEALIDLPPLAGDVLFAFCPDEEADSKGARTLRRLLRAEEEAGTHFLGCINTDFASPESGEDGHHFAFLGSVGKVLPALFIGGVPTHAAEPDGLTDPADLLAAVIHEVAFHPALADHVAGQDSPPPVLLHVEDSRTSYDVQTLSHAWAYLNALSLSRTPAAVLATFCRLVEGALATAAAESGEKLREQGYRPGPRPSLVTWQELAERLEEALPGALREIIDEARLEADPRRRSHLVVEAAWRRLGAPPIAVAFFAQDAIPRAQDDGGGLLAALRVACGEVLDEPLSERPFFPAISDMSFVARSPDDADHATFLANYPGAVVGETLGPAPAMPVIDIGPEGRDAHRPTERVEEAWSFDRLPRLLLATLRQLLA